MGEVVPSSSRDLILCWVALVVLSVATVWMGGNGSGQLLAAGVLSAGFAKAWIIIDHFMELRRVAVRWRLLMLGWPVTMALLIGFAFSARY